MQCFVSSGILSFTVLFQDEYNCTNRASACRWEFLISHHRPPTAKQGQNQSSVNPTYRSIVPKHIAYSIQHTAHTRYDKLSPSRSILHQVISATVVVAAREISVTGWEGRTRHLAPAPADAFRRLSCWQRRGAGTVGLHEANSTSVLSTS
jgi:hypothetical protein